MAPETRVSVYMRPSQQYLDEFEQTGANIIITRIIVIAVF